MTNATILHHISNRSVAKKPNFIEFIKAVVPYNELGGVKSQSVGETHLSKLPSSYGNIQLISLNWFGKGLDLMSAWDDNHLYPVLYLRHWNDGVVNN